MARSDLKRGGTPVWYMPLLTLFLLALFAGLFAYFAISTGGVRDWESFRAEVTAVFTEGYLWLAAGLTFFIGAFVGAIELIGRYRDEPMNALRSRGARTYILVNGLIAAAAFGGLLLFSDATPTNDPNDGTKLWQELIKLITLAGFGSLAVMRASFARTQIGETRVEVGPAMIIETLLAAADRSVDRYRAEKRILTIEDALDELGENVSVTAMQAVCLGAMQNIAETDMVKIRDRMDKALADLAKSSIASQPRLTQFIGGLILQQEVGTETFAQACAATNRLWRDKPQTAGSVSRNDLAAALSRGSARRMPKQNLGALGAAQATGKAPETRPHESNTP
ncbi:MAG: hypothetical protein AAF638_04565 [Pseudomonadota bacterium]